MAKTSTVGRSMSSVVQQADMLVDGVHCASCIWTIESALVAMPHVASARFNMSTRRLHLAWNGEAGDVVRYIETVENLGYKVQPLTGSDDAIPRDETAARLLKSVAVSGFAMGNIMLLSVALWTTDQTMMGVATRDLFHWITALIALPTVLYAGRPFFASAWAAIRAKHTNMDVPISVALILTSIMSLFETLRHSEHAYFDSVVMLLFFLLIGRYFDARARGKARESAEKLLQLLHGMARVLENGTIRTLPYRDLREGMVMQVAMGEKIPTDAVILEGESEIDTSLVTGETAPRTAKIGDEVFGGTLNLAAPLTLRVKRGTKDSLLTEIVRLMETAEQHRARYVGIAEKAARLYTPVVHILGAAAFLGWWLGAGIAWQQALMIGVTVLIITCPCALALAVPVVQVLASGWLMARGILLKSGDALERLAAISVVVFDKTGTLTEGKPVLQAGHYTPQKLALAAALAAKSNHPLAKALLTAAQNQNLELPAVTQIAEHAGLGMDARWQGNPVRLGRAAWCGVTVLSADGAQEIWLQVDGQEPVRFTFADALRSDTASVINELQQAGIAVHLLSGDRQSVTLPMAEKLGIANACAELLPAEKSAAIEALKQSGHGVLMVGDGLNDAPALAAATVSISPASGIDIAQNTADIVFQGGRLSAVLAAWRMAIFSTKLVKQNIALAVIYNLIAIPMAVAGYVTPFVAAIAMSSSSLIVIGNSFRIRMQKGNG